MPSLSFAPNALRRIPLAEIDAVVSARLGATRGLGNSQPTCFNRQIATYLAKHIGGWSTTVIGRFYNGRDHSTVCYGIQRIESLRESNSDVDVLITELKQQLAWKRNDVASEEIAQLSSRPKRVSQLSANEFADLVAVRVCTYLEQRMQRSEIREHLFESKLDRDEEPN